MLRLLALMVLIVPLTSGLRGADDLPPWLRQLSRDSLPQIDDKAPAVVLLDESTLSFDPQGVATMSSRWVVKVLKREGRDWADATATYETESDKVREFRAWLLRPDGTVKKYGKAETLDMALVSNDVYNQARRKIISATQEAEAGSVFGYEVILESRSIFAQYEWFFQSTLPVVLSRFRVVLPAGWTADGKSFNCSALDALRGTDGSYIWEMKGLPYLESQPMMPPLVNLVPRLAVSVFPAGTNPGLKTFTQWNDVARWLWELAESQRQPDAAIAAKARELAMNGSTELERLRALGRFAQSVNYVSIQTGIGRGGGYKPHAATEIMAKFYGDCKDKTNLMRSLLTVLEIPSYPVAVYASDRNYVRTNWPSPQQFNHAIIAVKVTDETVAGSVVEHPELGRLLLFDPTDEHTSLGDIPENLQGSLALVAHPDTQALLPVPVLAVEENCLIRTIEATLTPTGAMTASVIERSVGQAAASERSLYKRKQPDEYKKIIERWISGSIVGAGIKRLDCQDNLEANCFQLEVELTSPRYGQLMQNRLLVFKSALLSRRAAIRFMEGERHHPVEIKPEGFEDHTLIVLPPGFVVDELPEPVLVTSDFGQYESSCEIEGGTLRARRKLVLKPMFLGADRYAEVKSFFDRVSSSEQAPVVLLRK
jgi:hypothetical protein